MTGEKDHTLTIEKIASGGAGLGRLDGKVVFVPYTLPGETVEVRLVQEKKDYARAIPLRIAESSPLRRKAECPLFTVCGGCDFQHIDYAQQREIKRGLYREAFRRTGGIDLVCGEIPFEDSDPFGYRSRVQVHRASGRGWGYKEAYGGRVVPVEYCPVAVPEINAFFADGGKSVLSSGRERVNLFGRNGRLYSRDDEEIEVSILGKNLTFSTACFFQSNLPMLEKLVRGAFGGLSGSLALDLYGGVGVFGVFLADGFRRVVTVEENPVSAGFAGRNLPPDGTEVYPGSVEKWLESRGRSGGAGMPDLVIVDPPRGGLSPSVRNFLLKSCPPEIVYISCDAVTLARDARYFLDRGYSLKEFRIFDFYPQTAHMESLCRFALG